MIEPLEVLLVTIAASAKNEQWHGEGMYTLSWSEQERFTMFALLAKEAFETADCHLDRNKTWRVHIDAQRIVLKGARATQARKQIERVQSGDVPPFVWIPLASLTYHPSEN